MKATQAYGQVTARAMSARTIEWINELVGQFGDDVVADEIREVGGTNCPQDKILGRVRDRLAKRRAVETVEPMHLTGRQMLTLVRDPSKWPDRPITWTSDDLTPNEYQELLNFAMRRLGMRTERDLRQPTPDAGSAA